MRSSIVRGEQRIPALTSLTFLLSVLQVACLRQNVAEVNAQYAAQLSQHQAAITALEAELQEMKASLEQLQIKYTLLLELKPRLEREIEEYRKLLEGHQFEHKK